MSARAWFVHARSITLSNPVAPPMPNCLVVLTFTAIFAARAMPLRRGGGAKATVAEEAPRCSSGQQQRASLRQGIPAAVTRRWPAGWVAACLIATLPAARAACVPSPFAITLEPVGAGVWWVPAKRGDSDAGNRGQVSNLLLVRDGARVWLIGSGPSPAFGRALACQAQAVAGHPVTDIVSPWARPELVLGARGFAGARHWAHADVAQALRTRCPECVPRLRLRLGAAAADLGRQPVRAVDRQFHGAQGRLGPFEWWRVSRAAATAVTLWHVRGTPLLSAHGLLWAGALPDLREAELAPMAAATRRLHEIAAAVAPAPLLIGEQGPAARLAEVEAHLHYWQELAQTIDRAQAAGADGSQAQPLPGIEPALLRNPAHELNWQRAWRQAEDGASAPVAPAASQARGSFQRNLR
jgi:hypothetical protein